MNYTKQFNLCKAQDRVRASSSTYKIKLYLQKAENSLLIAQHNKNIVPTEDEPNKLHWNYWAITISYYSMLYAAKAAILSKGYEARDHDAVQIAIGFLLIPSDLEKHDLELLNQAHKIFEEEYVHTFADAKKESHIARYSAIKSYSEKRLDEVFKNATAFIAKINFMLEDHV